MPKSQFDSDMENPDEFAAWAFAAGIPDPRGQEWGHQPLVPAPCFPALSRMLWDMGFRHHADLQTKWVGDFSGPERNFVAVGLSDEPVLPKPEPRAVAREIDPEAGLSPMERLQRVNAELDRLRGAAG